MKTILRQNGSYVRMMNLDAQEEVLHRKGKYVSKSEWKKNVRDFKNPEDGIIKENKNKAKSKKLERRSKLKQKQIQN
jgi:hypothetical protein